jgi:spore maturation protein CgeB
MIRDIHPARARTIGEAARRRVLADHTYAQRGNLIDSVLQELLFARIPELELHR